MNDQMKTSNKTTLFIVVILALLLVVLAAMQLFRTNPDRVLNEFLTAVENGDRGAAMALVSDEIKTERRENIAWFVDDWTSAETVTNEITLEEAWRQRIKMEKNEAGEEVPVLNKYGDRDREIEPTPRLLAGFYHAEVTVSYDDDEDPIIITLRRKGDNQWSRLGTTFRGWEIVRVQYQPYTDEELDELGDQFFEFEGETEEDLEFEIDDDGNLVLPDEEGLILEGEGEKEGATKDDPAKKEEAVKKEAPKKDKAEAATQ